MTQLGKPPEKEVQMTMRLGDKCYHLLTSESMACPMCGFLPAHLEVDTYKGRYLYGMHFRITCSHDGCRHATPWVDSSSEAVQNWRMQRVLTR